MAAPTRWDNRIVGYGEEDPKTLRANALNWRKHPASQIAAVRAILEKIGWIQDVIVNLRRSKEWGAERNRKCMVDGHLRVDLALHDRQKSVPVKYVDLDPEQERLALATFDPLSAMAQTDGAKLQEVLAGIDLDNEALKAIGSRLQREADLAVKQAGLAKESANAHDLVGKGAALQEQWQPLRGQVWKLGRHRLMCGDSTKAKDVATLVGKTQVDGICTDPPFDLGASLIVKAFNLFGEKAILLAGDRLAYEMVNYWRFRHCFIWKHRIPSSSPNFNMPVLYHAQVLSLVRSERMKSDWRRPDKGWGSIIEEPSEAEGVAIEPNKPTKHEWGYIKSPLVFVEMLRGYPWKRIADPFAGSGSTVIASEMLGRQCLAMELSPRAVAVALERWRLYSPSDPPRRVERG